MPLTDIIWLTAIISLFVAFMVILGGTSLMLAIADRLERQAKAAKIPAGSSPAHP